MSAVGSIVARRSTRAVGWIGTSGRVVVVRRIVGLHRLAGNPVALRRPGRKIEQPAPLRAEWPVAVLRRGNLGTTDGTSAGAHGWKSTSATRIPPLAD